MLHLHTIRSGFSSKSWLSTITLIQITSEKYLKWVVKCSVGILVFSILVHPAMGSTLTCMPKKDLRGVFGSASKKHSRSSRHMPAEEELLHRQALSMMMQRHQLSQRFDGSMSRRIGSLSSRRRALSESFSNGKQVILVGHSCGGASISFALECYPKKISKAVFLTATMVSNEQRPFDVFAEELASAEIFMQQSQLLTYGNGRDKSPTALMFDKQHIKGLYFNNTPPKDIALATVSMRPIPLKPFMETLYLTPEKYGSVRRYFIQTLEDHMLSPDVQEKLVRENPPHGVYKIKGSDHCPFFSKPQSLHKILFEIARLP